MSRVATELPGIDRVVFSADRIAARARELGREIDEFYPSDEAILVLGLLKGAFIFVSDLVRAIARPTVEVDFVIAALYGDGTAGDREVQLLYGPESRLTDRHVLLVEDIVDSGKTLNRIGDALIRKDPRSLEVCALLHKGLAEDLRFEPRWVGFDAPRDWLVGYGLDHAGRYRHLPFIAAVDRAGERGS